MVRKEVSSPQGRWSEDSRSCPEEQNGRYRGLSWEQWASQAWGYHYTDTEIDPYDLALNEAVSQGWLDDNHRITADGKKYLEKFADQQTLAIEDRLFEANTEAHEPLENKVKRESMKNGVVDLLAKFEIFVDTKNIKVERIDNGFYRVVFLGKPSGGNSKLNKIVSYAGKREQIFSQIEREHESLKRELIAQGIAS